MAMATRKARITVRFGRDLIAAIGLTAMNGRGDQDKAHAHRLERALADRPKTRVNRLTGDLVIGGAGRAGVSSDGCRRRESAR